MAAAARLTARELTVLDATGGERELSVLGATGGEREAGRDRSVVARFVAAAETLPGVGDLLWEVLMTEGDASRSSSRSSLTMVRRLRISRS